MPATLYVHSRLRNDTYNSDMHTMVLSTRTRCLAAADTGLYLRDDLKHLGERRLLIGEDRWAVIFLPRLQAALNEDIQVCDRALFRGLIASLGARVRRTPVLLVDERRYAGFDAICQLIDQPGQPLDDLT